jgi:hypothetical protein
MATRVRAVDALGDVTRAHADPAFDVRTDTVLVRDPEWPGVAPPALASNVVAAPAMVIAAEPRAARLRAEVDTSAAGVVVWSRTFFPAWRATVDGAATAVVLADGHLVGVPVPAGRHVVAVWWPAWPVLAGLAASALGLLALVLLRR